jgi:hypothetical protein
MENESVMKRLVSSHIIVFIVLSLCFSTAVYSEETLTFYKKIKGYDLSPIWASDKIRIDDSDKFVSRIDPIGFIGENFERFRIHFISAKKNLKNPYRYNVYGKTKVRNKVFSFQGTIHVTKAKLYKENDFPPFREGFVSGTYRFIESRGKTITGVLSGSYKSYFLIDEKNRLEYDSLGSDYDGFANNQFKGIRKENGSKTPVKCNWGDGRIPEAEGKLDVGVGEFYPSNEYMKNGWETYRRTLDLHGDEQVKMMIAIKNEDLWWKK